MQAEIRVTPSQLATANVPTQPPATTSAAQGPPATATNIATIVNRMTPVANPVRHYRSHVIRVEKRDSGHHITVEVLDTQQVGMPAIKMILWSDREDFPNWSRELSNYTCTTDQQGRCTFPPFALKLPNVRVGFADNSAVTDQFDLPERAQSVEVQFVEQTSQP